MSKTQAECKSKFELACASFVAEIDEIDADTPWSDTEPYWWLKMMEIRHICYEVASAPFVAESLEQDQ
jgi:hypothetical protein